ncbi:hypothetical protein [Methylomonas sp. MgM2]
MKPTQNIIPANPGFSAITLCTNIAGRLSYYRESIIAWHISGSDDIAQDSQNLFASPVLPGSIGVYDEYDAIEHPNGTIQDPDKTYKNLADWLEYKEAERGKE